MQKSLVRRGFLAFGLFHILEYSSACIVTNILEAIKFNDTEIYKCKHIRCVRRSLLTDFFAQVKLSLFDSRIWTVMHYALRYPNRTELQACLLGNGS
jgi:hypothetical protein